jgi:hypothetical protein
LFGLVLNYVSGFVLYQSQLAADTQPLTDKCGMRLMVFTDLESKITKFPTRCRSILVWIIGLCYIDLDYRFCAILVWITGFVLRFSNLYLLGYTGSGACMIKAFLVFRVQQ